MSLSMSQMMTYQTSSKTQEQLMSPLAEVIGHSLKKEPHVLKNLYLKIRYNFECKMKMTDAQDKQKLQQPLLLYNDCIELRSYAFIEELSISEQHRQERLNKVKSLMLNPAKLDVNPQQGKEQRDSKDQQRAKR